MIKIANLGRLVLSGFLLFALGVSAQEPAAVKKSTDPCQAQVELKKTTIQLLRSQLKSRDKTIDALEEELDSRKDNLSELRAQVQDKDREIERLSKLLDFQKSLTKFQEGQIEKFREVTTEQRGQLKALTTQVEQK